VSYCTCFRPPTSAPETRSTIRSTLKMPQRPTTAPAFNERRRTASKATVIDTSVSPLKTITNDHMKVKSAHSRPSTHVIDSSNNFDNLRHESFLSLTDGLKSAIFKSENNFVHQLCANSTLNTSSHDSIDELLTPRTRTTTLNDDENNKENQNLNTTMSETLLDLNSSKICGSVDDEPTISNRNETKTHHADTNIGEVRKVYAINNVKLLPQRNEYYACKRTPFFQQFYLPM